MRRRRSSTVITVVFFLVVVYVIVSIATMVATDDACPGLPREWRYAPPGWECVRSFR